jgi:hypothetical protein
MRRGRHAIQGAIANLPWTREIEAEYYTEPIAKSSYGKFSITALGK